MNQAVFERFLVGEGGSPEAELTPAFKFLLDPDLITAEGHPQRPRPARDTGIATGSKGSPAGCEIAGIRRNPGRLSLAWV